MLSVFNIRKHFVQVDSEVRCLLFAIFTNSLQISFSHTQCKGYHLVRHHRQGPGQHHLTHRSSLANQGIENFTAIYIG